MTDEGNLPDLPAEMPADLDAVITAMTRPELMVLCEVWAPRLASMQAPGMVQLGTLIFGKADQELAQRARQKAVDRATLETLDAELMDPLEEADLTGLPTWAEASADPDEATE